MLKLNSEKVTILTLKRYEKQQEHDSDDRRLSDLLVHQIRNQHSFQRSNPQEMGEDDGYVESVHIVRQQIHHLSGSGVAESRLAQLQRLSVDEGAASHPHFHAQMKDTHHVGVDEEDIEEGAENNSAGVEIGVPLGYMRLIGSVVVDELTES